MPGPGPAARHSCPRHDPVQLETPVLIGLICFLEAYAPHFESCEHVRYTRVAGSLWQALMTDGTAFDMLLDSAGAWHVKVQTHEDLAYIAQLSTIDA